MDLELQFLFNVALYVMQYTNVLILLCGLLFTFKSQDYISISKWLLDMANNRKE